jgi:hypothetical protein
MFLLLDLDTESFQVAMVLSKLHRLLQQSLYKLIIGNDSIRVLFQKDFSLSVDAYFIAHSWFVRTRTIGEVRMVCLYGTLPPFPSGKAFTC